MTKTKDNRYTKDQNTKTTGVDSVDHQTGPGRTYTQAGTAEFRNCEKKGHYGKM